MPLLYSLYADLIGKPFLEGGRGPDAYDCVGLAMEVQRRRGATLPAYLSHPEELHRQLAAGGVLEEQKRIILPEAGCVVLLRSFGAEARHMGVMLDEHWMLHCSESARGVVREAIAYSLWGRRIVGLYRVEVVH